VGAGAGDKAGERRSRAAFAAPDIAVAEETIIQTNISVKYTPSETSL
jgi:hypothetical protein